MDASRLEEVMGTLVPTRAAYDPFAVVMGGKRGLGRLEALREVRVAASPLIVYFYGEHDDCLRIAGDIAGRGQYSEYDGPFSVINGVTGIEESQWRFPEMTVLSNGSSC